MGIFYEDYEELGHGYRWRSAERTISAENIETFAALTGDHHPQHMNDAYARASPYGARIAHGYLTASLAAGLAYQIGLDDGTSHAILQISWRFPMPVLIGDRIYVDVTLEEVRPSRKYPAMGIVQRTYEVFTQRGDVAAAGDMTILCKRR